MKKFMQKIAAILALILCASLPIACSNGKDSQDRDNLKKLVIGVDYYEPFVFLNPDGNFSGFDIDIATEVCRHIGYEPQFVYIDWSLKKSYLSNGEIDCIWTCFSCTGRENDYDWTLPYIKSRQVVAVGKYSKIKTIADLKDKMVGVQSATKADEIFSGKVTLSNVEIPKIKRLVCFSQASYLYASLSSGLVDAVASHQVVIEAYTKYDSFEIKVLEEPILEVDVAVAFQKDTHADVIKSINDTFLLLKNNGYLTQLYSEYGFDKDKYMVDYE